MRILILFAAAAMAWGQSTVKQTIIPKQDDSATGTLNFREKYANGVNVVGFRAPVSIAADKIWILPSADGTSGYCLTTDGALTLSWAACAGSTAPFIDSTAIIKGSVDATKLLAIEVDGFTTATTRTLTPQDASYTIAGTNLAQTFSAAQTFSSSVTISTGASNGYVWTSNGVGLGAWAASAACATCFVNGGNAFAANATIGLTDAYKLGIKTDNAIRWNVSPVGMLYPEIDDTYDIGLTGTRARTVYAKAGEFYKVGSTSSSDYVTTRKLNIWDSTGASGGWDFQAITTGTASSLLVRDNAGTSVINFVRKLASVATDYADVYVDLYPDTHNGQKLGMSGKNWSAIYVSDINTSGGSVYGHLIPAGTNTYALGTTSQRWSEVDGVLGDFSTSVSTANLTATGTTTLTSAGATAGKVWTSTNTTGIGSWVTPTSSQWTTTGSDIYYTTGVALLGRTASDGVWKLQVEAVTADQISVTGTTAGSAGGGGIQYYSSVTPTALDDRLGVNTFGVRSGGTSYNRAAVTGRAAQAWTLGSAEGARLLFGTTANGSTTRTDRWSIENNGHLFAVADNTYDIGASGASRPKDIYAAGVLKAASATLTTGAVNGYILTSDGAGAGTWQANAAAPKSTTISTTSPLTGGGDFTTNRTFACATCVTTDTTQTISGAKTLGASLAAGITDTYDIGSSVRFRNIYGQVVNSAYFEVANGTSVTTFWRHLLASASTYRLNSGSGGQTELQILTTSSTDTQFGLRGTIYPLSTAGSNGDIGYSGTPWRTQYLSTSAFMNGTQWMDSSRNLSNIGNIGNTGNLTGALTVTGNLYIRTFSAANASCTGVADGWIGFRTDTDEIQMCSGGALKKVTLL